MLHYYTIYDRNQNVVAFGTSKKVCEILNIKLEALYCAVSRQRKNKVKKPKRFIVVEIIDTNE